MNDKAIEFESSNIKFQKALTKLKTAGLNVTKYENAYNEIISNLHTDNKTIPTSIVDTNSFATDYLTANYSEAIKKLEFLYLELTKYEIYVRVSAFTSYLKEFVKNPKKNSENFETYRESLIDIINKLIRSNTLDYDVEGNIIEEIYEITYYFIKEEIKILGYSKTLAILENNEININFLDKQIIKELETIDFKNPKYANILKMKNQIDSQGFNNPYVSEEFIRELVTCNLNREDIIDIIEILDTKINDNITKLNRIHYELEDEEEKKRKLQKQNNKHRNDILKQTTLFLTSAAIIIGLIFGSIKLAKFKKYYKTINTYSPKNGITTEATYKRGKKDKILIYELAPYKKYESAGFKRETITYDVTDITDISIEEYLDLDLKSLGIDKTRHTEYKNSLTPDDTYDETIRFVEQSIVNENDYQEKTSIGGLIALLLLSAIIEIIIEKIFWEIDFNDSIDPAYPALIAAIIEIKKDFESIKDCKYNQQIIKEKLNELNEKSNVILKENKELISKLLGYYKFIKNNPEYHEETEKIEKTLKLIKK